jgi:hypothetical protein
MPDTALVCLSHGFHVRNIVYSPLYERLTQNLSVTLLLPAGVAIPPESRHLLRGATILPVDVVPHRFEKLFLFLRKNVFAGRERTQTFNLISELERSKHPLAYRLAGYCNAVLGRFPAVARLWQRIEARFVPGREFDPVLSATRPKVVVTANYGTEAFEVRLLRSAHRHGVPSLAIIPSWDNLSSKGVIGENPRNLAVWNTIMRDEAKSLYGFTDAAVHVCGGLQFDLYASVRPAQEREQILQRLGIDARHPFVVIGTITPRYFPNNVDIVDIVNDAVATGQLPADLQIVVRLHPQVVDGSHFADNLDQYRERATAHSRIKLSIPSVLRWGSITPPTPEDGVELMTLLSLAAVSVMPASTLAIDACALGAPVIGIGFDGYHVKPYAQSVRRTFDFTHYRRIVAQGGLRIAESREMLISELQAYLNDRTRDQEGRARIVASHLGAVDGSSWRRVLGVLDRLAASAG